MLLASSPLNAQSKAFDEAEYQAQAREHLKHGNYPMALKVLRELYKKDPKSSDINYKLAFCYLNTNISKKEAIPYLEFVTKQPKMEDDAFFLLGTAYHLAHRFEDAIKAFQKHKEKFPKDAARADRQIEMCNNAKVLIKAPINVKFENLGKEVNSEYPDYHPFATEHEDFVIFTSRRKGNTGASSVEIDGYYSSDILQSMVKNGKFTKAKSLAPPINGNFDEQAVGLSPDGKNMLVYIDNIDEAGNLYWSKSAKTFGKPEKMVNNVNSGFESSGSITADGNVLVFASRRDGGQGEKDIYICRKLPNGEWGLPFNLGLNVNTKYDEDFPHITEDGTTLYFASEGHNSMGGLDVFESKLNTETNTWSKPKNMGYPLNTADDNYNVSFCEDKRIAYVSAVREGGFGDLDIYRVKFNEAEQKMTIVTGKVITPDSSLSAVEGSMIIVTDASTSEEIGTYIPSPRNGKFVMALPPGKYIINYEIPGYKPYVGDVLIFDLDQKDMMAKDLVLSK